MRILFFGEEVLAPCSGVVVSMENSLVDLPAGERDRTHMEGNYVLLACNDFQVLLGHLQQDSLEVLPGQAVASGQVLGRVGNTGNTDFPHLHIHAQSPVSGGAVSAGAPLEIRFADRYLIRGDVVRLY
jgi:murein DD-endopeptidase MepM/ murein hydrolase activator NlpD